MVRNAGVVVLLEVGDSDGDDDNDSNDDNDNDDHNYDDNHNKDNIRTTTTTMMTNDEDNNNNDGSSGGGGVAAVVATVSMLPLQRGGEGGNEVLECLDINVIKGLAERLRSIANKRSNIVDIEMNDDDNDDNDNDVIDNRDPQV